MIDALFSALKFAAILLGGLFGTIGLLVDYKDKSGKITRWGRRALLGVIVSTVVATTIQGLEIYKARHESASQQARTQTMLREIRRAVYPIRDVYVDATFKCGFDDPRLALYRTRLDDFVQQALASLPAIHGEGPYSFGGAKIKISDTNHPFCVAIPSRSSAFPNATTEPVAWSLLSRSHLVLAFYRDAFKLGDSQHGWTLPNPDLSFTLAVPSAVTLNWYFLYGDLPEIEFERMPGDVTTYVSHSTGRIVSVEDLAGAMLYITFESGDTADEQIAANIRRKWELLSLTLNISGRKFMIFGEALQKGLSAHERYFVFPERLADEIYWRPNETPAAQ